MIRKRFPHTTRDTGSKWHWNWTQTFLLYPIDQCYKRIISDSYTWQRNPVQVPAVRYHVLRKQHAHTIVTTYKLPTICSIALCKSPSPLREGRGKTFALTQMVRAPHARWAIDRNDTQKKTPPTRLACRIEPKSKDITRAHIATTIHKIPFF